MAGSAAASVADGSGLRRSQLDGYFDGGTAPWLARQRASSWVGAPPLRCEWSAALPNAYVAGCPVDPCSSFAALPDALAACEADSACGNRPRPDRLPSRSSRAEPGGDRVRRGAARCRRRHVGGGRRGAVAAARRVGAVGVAVERDVVHPDKPARVPPGGRRRLVVREYRVRGTQVRNEGA